MGFTKRNLLLIGLIGLLVVSAVLFVFTDFFEGGEEGRGIIWVEGPTKKIFRDFEGSGLVTKPSFKSNYSLAIARNGIDFFQVVVTANESSLYDVYPEARVFDESGNLASGIFVNLYLEYYVNVRSETYYESVLDYELGYYPDALVPITGSFDVDYGVNQPIWVEVIVARDALPGNYTGVIEFSGGISGSVTFSLEVLNFVLPEHSGLFNYGYADFWIFDEIYGALDDEAYFNLIKSYTRFFSERDINIAWTFDVDELPIKDSSGKWNFTIWLEGMLPLLNSGVMELQSKPVIRVPVDLEVLGINESDADTLNAQNEYIDFLKQFHNYISTQDLIDLSGVEWVIFISEFDEPNSEELTYLISLYYNLTQQVNQQLTGFDFKYLIQGSIDWDSPAIQHAFGSEVVNWTRLANSFDYWEAPQEDFEFDLDFIKNNIERGKHILIYQQSWTALSKDDPDIPPNAENRDYEFPSLPGIVNPAIFHRILPWFLWKYNLQGVGFWAVMHWYDEKNWKPINVWEDDPALWISFRGEEQAQNGDGWLVYPGDQAEEYTGMDNVEGPISSIRLELFRKGLEDYKYIKLLNDILNNLSPSEKIDAENTLNEINTTLASITSFPRDPHVYDTLINTVKRLINNHYVSLKNTYFDTKIVDTQASSIKQIESSNPTIKTNFAEEVLNTSICLISVVNVRASYSTRELNKKEN